MNLLEEFEAMGINTITQAFEKAEKGKKKEKKKYKMGLYPSLGLNLILLVLMFLIVPNLQNKSTANEDSNEKILLLEKRFKDLQETNEVLTETLQSKIPKLINVKTYPKTIMSTKRLTKQQNLICCL